MSWLVEKAHILGMTKITVLHPRQTRLSAKLRHAIEIMVEEGKSQVKAAEEAGMSRQGLGKALKKPAVREHMQAVETQFIARSEARRSLYRARALEAAWELAQNAQSEAVRARMIEFLASDAKVSPVAVHIDARHMPGYEYAQPGAKIVEIEQPLQPVEKIGE